MIDGVDPWSTLPSEQFRYAVYQQRMSLDILQTQVIAQAILSGPDKAQAAMEQYLDAAVPLSQDVITRRDRGKERLLEEIANMAPVPVSEIRLGNPIGGKAVESSMFRK